MTALTLTGCSQTTSGDSGGGGGYGSGDYNLQTFTSIAEFEAWLRKQPYIGNSAAKPYNVKLNVSDLGGAYTTSGSVGSVLYFTGRYVNLDLSGSTFPNIYVDAFTSCNLTSVTIPNSVTSIGASAFSYCSSLTAITVNASNSACSSENGVLYNKTKTTLEKYPEGKTGASFTIPASVTSIATGAFRPTSITIPNSVTTIGDYAFNRCKKLTSVTIGNSVTTIGESTFIECYSLTSVTFATISKVTSIGNDVFGGCPITSITIPASVTSIATGAFRNTSLISVTFATGSNISDGNFEDNAFPEGTPGQTGNTLKTAYSAGKAGTYTRPADGYTWKKS